MLDALQRLGASSLTTLERLGRGHLFLLHVLSGIPGLVSRIKLVIQQIYSVGVLSLLIIGVAGLFVGMVLALQGYNTLVDFGADGCKPCEMMEPILATLKKKYKGKANVVFVHVREHQMLATRYGIQSIPVQIFFDKNGKEVFRHVGFFAQEEIEEKLEELGVQ